MAKARCPRCGADLTTGLEKARCPMCGRIDGRFIGQEVMEYAIEATLVRLAQPKPATEEKTWIRKLIDFVR